MSEELDMSLNSRMQPLVSTEFVSWSCKYFSKSVMKTSDGCLDLESDSYKEKEWR